MDFRGGVGFYAPAMALEERIKKSRVEEGGGEPSSGSTLDTQIIADDAGKKQ
jgi:hypothetical protein